MFVLLAISGGLFLGWSLGANDASNLFGTAVGTRMVKFRTAALVSSIFVILGAVLQGSGTTQTLSALGAIDALGGAFTVALCSGIIVTLMTKYKLPVSTGQVIVGAIVGWCYYTSQPVEYGVLAKIVGSWVFGPILGGLFSAGLYLLLRRYIRHSRMHLLKMESIIRVSLIVVGAFGAYSLGANNIANVMGVFVNAVSFSVSLGPFSFSSVQVLFFIGALAISLGIFTYSRRVMETIGNGVLEMTPEMAIVVVLTQAIVLFLFSSTSFSDLLVSIGLPAIPLVPVSSTQVVVGALVGVGLVKGVQEIRLKMLGNIALSWLVSPVVAGIFTYVSLAFVQRVFGVAVSLQMPEQAGSVATSATNYHFSVSNQSWWLLLLLLAVVTGLLIYIVYLQRRLRTAERTRRKISDGM